MPFLFTRKLVSGLEYASFVFTWRGALQWRTVDTTKGHNCSQYISGAINWQQNFSVISVVSIDKLCRQSPVTNKIDS